MEYLLTDNILTIKVDASLYNETVLYKCFYWYSREFNVTISQADDRIFTVSIVSKREGYECSWDKIIEKAAQDLIDFRLRDIVNNETRAIRELIVAKAFVHYDMEKVSSANIADPVGFDPLNI